MIREPGPTLEQSAKWIAAFRGKTMVVKLGGELFVNSGGLGRLAKQVAVLAQCGVQVVVVHGAGRQVDEAAAAAGLETVKIGGRRVTDQTTRDLLVGVLKRLNSDLVMRLREVGLESVGMDDFEEWPVVCTKRPPVPQSDGTIVDFGYVGDVVAVTKPVGNGVVVLPSLGFAEELGFLNINADTLACSVALQLGAVKVVFMTSVPGLMRNMDDAGPVSTISSTDLRAFLSSPAVSGGMRAKLEECLRALDGGVDQVHIVSGHEPYTLLREVYTDEGCGTLVYR